jgi:hypothetical protein
MKNMFIPYELAVKAYEKGFEIKSYGIGWYYKRRSTGDIHGLDTFYIDTNQNIQQWESIDEPIEAILYQQILDWLREKHNLNIWLIENPYTQGNGSGMYEWNIKPRMVKNQPLPQPKGLGSGCGTEYYEALNNAIKQALNLI